MRFAIEKIQIGQGGEARTDFSNTNAQNILRRRHRETLGLDALL